MRFVNRLTISLELKVGSKNQSVPGGNIKVLKLEFQPWGFTAEAVFWLVSQASQSEDTLFDGFVGSDRIDVTLKIDRTFDKVGESAQPIQLTGLVEERSVVERAFEDLSGGPVLHRRYALKFRDPAAVVWSRHRPVTLLVDSTQAQLISQETPGDVKITSTWGGSKTKYPVLSLGLGADPSGAAFWDFLFWLADREGFGVHFDPDKKKYTLDDKKPQAKAESLHPDDIESTEILFDPPARHAVQILNGAAEAQTKLKKVANARAYSGVRQDTLLVTPIAKDVDTAATEAKGPLEVPPPRLLVRFARYPSITMRPLAQYNFTEDFSTQIYLAKKTFRLNRLWIDARAERQAATDDSDDDSNSYELEVTGEFETTTDERWPRPPYRVPGWPFHVEGTVVSDQGAKEEGTFQAYTDSATKLDHHFVMVPLWGKKVRAPYHPNLLQGHFYFPPVKDQRVLLALFFDHASIERYLDWRPGARLPKESQGNHILFGKKADDQTSVRHVYEDSKPVLTVERSSAKDQQTIVVSEGTIRLETKETKK